MSDLHEKVRQTLVGSLSQAYQEETRARAALVEATVTRRYVEAALGALTCESGGPGHPIETDETCSWANAG